MLSRRQLRVKVLQALYAYFQSDKKELPAAERELTRSIEKVHELYIYILQFIVELGEADLADAGELHHKYFPDQEELKAILRLNQFGFVKELQQSSSYAAQVKRWKTTWQKDHELVRKLFLEIKRSP